MSDDDKWQSANTPETADKCAPLMTASFMVAVDEDGETV
jgi:hypothetical protein